MVITANQGLRGGKVIELKDTVDKAVDGLEFVRHVFVMKRTDADIQMNEKDIILEEVCML